MRSSSDTVPCDKCMLRAKLISTLNPALCSFSAEDSISQGLFRDPNSLDRV